jgi:uncharacterized membrane-anchored protein
MTPLAARSHPLRLSLTEEMHVRRFPSFVAPAQAVQLLVVNSPGTDGDSSYRHMAALCERLGAAPPPPAKHALASLGELDMVWEQHSEFCTYSFILSGSAKDIFGVSPLDGIPSDWIEALPGEVYRATQIVLLDAGSPEPDVAELARHFRIEDLVSCDVYEGSARIWADFRQSEDGFGRLLIRDQGLTGTDTPRLVQQLQELGNYRKMALLGMPVVQTLGIELATAEDRLAQLSRAIASEESEPEILLHDLSSLSATLARLQADTRFRMGATEAYADLVTDRLESLKEGRLPGYPGLKDFNERRLLPAVRTCRSFGDRLEDVARRASWITALLRTRVDTTMAQQSRDLLASMNRRTRLQLRLQQTVEGLSAVAITYYLIGLIHYVAEGFAHRPGVPDPAVIAAAAVPLILILVIIGLRRVHAGLHDDADPG